MSQQFFDAITSYNNAISNAQAYLKAGVTKHKGGREIYAPDYAARQAAVNQAVQNKSNYINQYPENAAKNPDPYMSDSFTPTDWGKKTTDYNAQIDALKKQGMTWGEYNRINNRSIRGGPDPRTFRLNDGVQAQIDALTLQRDNLPTLIAAENAGIGAAKVIRQKNADILAEDTAIQEKAQAKNLAARSSLNRLNQLGVESDQRSAADRSGMMSNFGRGAGGGFDLSKQKQAAQQSVGAAMSGTPSVSAFAGKAASVAPTNLVAQTANTGALKNQNIQNQGLDSAVSSRAANAVAAAGFKLPNTAGVQIGESQIQKFGGS